MSKQPGAPITLSVVLTAAQAWQLAQFVKRIGWSEIRQNASTDDEAYVMRAALAAIREELAEQGYAPR